MITAAVIWEEKNKIYQIFGNCILTLNNSRNRYETRSPHGKCAVLNCESTCLIIFDVDHLFSHIEVKKKKSSCPDLLNSAF